MRTLQASQTLRGHILDAVLEVIADAGFAASRAGSTGCKSVRYKHLPKIIQKVIPSEK